MRIRVEITQFKQEKPNVSEYSSISEFKEVLAYLLEETVYLPEFDNAGIMLIDDNGVLISEITLVRIEASNNLYSVAVSVNVNDKTVLVGKYQQSIWHFWYYLNEYVNAD